MLFCLPLKPTTDGVLFTKIQGVAFSCLPCFPLLLPIRSAGITVGPKESKVLYRGRRIGRDSIDDFFCPSWVFEATRCDRHPPMVAPVDDRILN